MEAQRLASWRVSAEETGQRVQTFVVERLQHKYSGKEIKKAIERNALKVNDVQERHASRRLATSDIVLFDLSLLSSAAPSKTIAFDKKRLLYEDTFFLIYNKPAGITSVEGGLLDILHQYNSLLINVHRLDKETTGAIIFAKSEKVKKLFIEQFRNQSLDKRYLAIVDGIVKRDSGRIERPIGKLSEKEGDAIWGIKPVERGGVPAATEWRVLCRGADASLIECSLVTGRTHQIRIHLTHLGHPIIGDVRYGKLFQGSYQPPHQLLHAWLLQFTHPITGEIVKFKAPLSEEFCQALKQLDMESWTEMQ